MRLFVLATIYIISFAFVFPDASAQFDQDVEKLYDSFETKESTKKNIKRKKRIRRRKRRDADISKISQLGNLAPFQDIAVIQRRSLPKTKRFEFSGSLLSTTNNAFFSNFGAALSGTWHLNENYGIEGKYMFLSSSKRDVTENLAENQSIDTKSFVQPEAYYGVSLRWSPIYGKMAWFDSKIMPYDIYFTPGIGMTKTALQNELTFSIGTGQLFAASKSLAFKWDFTWNFYQATVQEGATGGAKTENKRTTSDLVLSVGVSYFIPEATYR